MTEQSFGGFSIGRMTSTVSEEFSCYLQELPSDRRQALERVMEDYFAATTVLLETMMKVREDPTATIEKVREIIASLTEYIKST